MRSSAVIDKVMLICRHTALFQRRYDVVTTLKRRRGSTGRHKTIFPILPYEIEVLTFVLLPLIVLYTHVYFIHFKLITRLSYDFLHDDC